MKRYSQILDRNLDNKPYIRVYESDHGEWVKYEDVLKLLDPDMLFLMCNCAEKTAGKQPITWRSVKGSAYFSWICPAHGYKRL